MSGKGKWAGVPPTTTEEIADRYETACLIAMQRARQLESDDAKFAARFREMRDGIWAGIAQELRDLGCPENELAGEVANVVNFAVRKRGLRGIAGKGASMIVHRNFILIRHGRPHTARMMISGSLSRASVCIEPRGIEE